MPQKTNLELISEEERKIIEARRAYKKQWRTANKDKVREYNRRFWLKKAAELSDNQKSRSEV